MGFKKCSHEHTLFTKKGDKNCIPIVSLYVGDLIYTESNDHMIDEFKRSMKEEFDMSDLGRMRYLLGVEVLQNHSFIFINQNKYVNEVLKRFGMAASKPVANPVTVGSNCPKMMTVN